MVEQLTERELDNILEEGKDHVIEFGADWCAPCEKYEPIFKSVAEEIDEVKFGKVDMEEDKEAGLELGVRSLPTTVIIRDGEEVARKAGKIREDKLKEWVEDEL